MSNFNRFGATSDDVMRQYSSGEYSAVVADFGGQTNVDAVLDDVEHQIVQALPEQSLSSLIDPDMEMLERRAIAGQTTVTASFLPLASNRISVWTGQPLQFVSRPMKRTDRGAAYNDGIGAGYAQGYGSGPAIELSSSKFSVVTSTGVITLTDALNADDVVYASYQVDVSSADFSVPSLASLLSNGAAAQLGQDYFSRSDSLWGKVESLSQAFNAALEAMAEGKWIVPEIRRARWWQEITPSSDKGAGSLRIYRA